MLIAHRGGDANAVDVLKQWMVDIDIATRVAAEVELEKEIRDLQLKYGFLGQA